MSVAAARLTAATALTLVAAMLALAWPATSDAARVRCAATFRVLHDDRIGALELPRGNYRITILASGRPGCAAAPGLFARFLEDFDGRLPGGWRVVAGNASFVRSPGVGFHVARVGTEGRGGEEREEAGGGGRYPVIGSACPGTFRVLHDDKIGSLRLPRGPYTIYLLQRRGLTCSQASRLLTRFLALPAGNLPLPWVLEPQTASFLRGGGVGFRIDPAA